jgi:hypothetical protein
LRLFHLIVTVWGQDYVDRFLDIALPSLLSPGNLPALAEYKTRFVFVTAAQEQSWLRRSPLFGELENLTDVRFLSIDPQMYETSFQAMSAAHRIAGRESMEDGAHAIIVSPDFVISAGSLAGAPTAADSGVAWRHVARRAPNREALMGPKRPNLRLSALAPSPPAPTLKPSSSPPGPDNFRSAPIRRNFEKTALRFLRDQQRDAQLLRRELAGEAACILN